jgi:hypothetical protein
VNKRSQQNPPARVDHQIAAGTEVSLLTHDEEEESFKPTDAGMAAALGFMV